MIYTDRNIAPLSFGRSAAKRLLLLIVRYSIIFREKRAFKNLDDRLLKDIGISQADRDTVLKQFWGAPDHWTQE
jgi:uncharacterized protein YjiS (DUF1127 family)